jgi:antitoxin MazE
MKTNLVQIGNSRGVRIPKPLLEQLKFETVVEFEILPDGLLLRPVREKTQTAARAGWDEMFKAALAENGDDKEEFSDWNQAELTEFDKKEWR